MCVSVCECDGSTRSSSSICSANVCDSCSSAWTFPLFHFQFAWMRNGCLTRFRAAALTDCVFASRLEGRKWREREDSGTSAGKNSCWFGQTNIDSSVSVLRSVRTTSQICRREREHAAARPTSCWDVFIVVVVKKKKSILEGSC